MLRFQVFVVGLVQRLVELRADFNLPRAEVRHKADRNGGAVGKHGLQADRQIVGLSAVNGVERQTRREQDIAHAVLVVPGADFAENRKGRIVDHDAPCGIVGAFVIRAGIEGTDDLSAVQAVVLHGEVPHGAVDVVRRVHVVRCEIRLELVDEGLVLFSALGLHVAPEGRVVLPEHQPLRVVAGQRDVEARGGQFDHLGPQHGLVGAALAQEVVGVYKRAPLVVAEAFDLDAREVRVAPLPRRQDAPVSVDQPSLAVDARRYDPPELVEAVNQLVELLLRVQLCVMLVWDQLVNLLPDKPDRRFAHVVLRLSFSRPISAAASVFGHAVTSAVDLTLRHATTSAVKVRVSRPRPAPRAKSH